MKAKIYYLKASEEMVTTFTVSATWKEWTDGIAGIVAAGGMVTSDDFSFPARNIYYIEKLED